MPRIQNAQANSGQTLSMNDLVSSSSTDDILGSGINNEMKNKFPLTIIIQAYSISAPRFRRVVVGENPDLPHGALLMEMSMHTPTSVKSGYDLKRIWVAVPNGFSTLAGKENNITSISCLTNLMKGKVFNNAIIHGTAVKAFVPDINWVGEEEGITLDALKRSNKVVESDVLLSGVNGFVPNLSYDHTANFNNKEVDWEDIRVNYKHRGDNLRPLGAHPTTNFVSGNGAINPDLGVSDFYSKSGIQLGVGKTGMTPKEGQPDYRRNRYYAVGIVHHTTAKNAKAFTLGFNFDDSRALKDGDASYSLGVESRMLRHTYNEFSFNGSLRIHETKSSAVVFRISVGNYNPIVSTVTTASAVSDIDIMTLGVANKSQAEEDESIEEDDCPFEIDATDASAEGGSTDSSPLVSQDSERTDLSSDDEPVDLSAENLDDINSMTEAELEKATA